VSPEGKGAALARLIEALPPERREQVFTHTSWAPDRSSSYERLEFLGDSVLELAIARALYDRFPDSSEGRLAKIRAHVVSRQSCAAVARELGLGATLVARAQDVPQPELRRISLSRNVLAALLEAHRSSGGAATVLSFVPDDVRSYGRIVRDDRGDLVAIVEAADASDEVLSVREANSSIYVFRAEALWPALDDLTPANAQGELYLTDAVRAIAGAGSIQLTSHGASRSRRSSSSPPTGSTSSSPSTAGSPPWRRSPVRASSAST